MGEQPQTVDKLMEEESNEVKIAGAILDSRQVASIISAFHQALKDDGVDAPTLDQATLLYARKVLFGRPA